MFFFVPLVLPSWFLFATALVVLFDLIFSSSSSWFSPSSRLSTQDIRQSLVEGSTFLFLFDLLLFFRVWLKVSPFLGGGAWRDIFFFCLISRDNIYRCFMRQIPPTLTDDQKRVAFLCPFCFSFFFKIDLWSPQDIMNHISSCVSTFKQSKENHLTSSHFSRSHQLNFRMSHCSPPSFALGSQSVSSTSTRLNR